MNLKTAFIKEGVPRQICLPFEFLGNIGDCKVKKNNSNFDPFGIRIASGCRVLCSIKANLLMFSRTTLKLILRYDVWESSYGVSKTKKSANSIYFGGLKEFDLNDLFKDEIKKQGWKNTEDLYRMSLNPISEAYYIGFYNIKDSHADWLPIAPDSYAESNRNQTWLPIEDIRVKIDRKVCELNSVGNIGVKGCIKFNLS